MQRRDFLKGMSAGALLFGSEITAEELNNSDKSVIWLFCQGGMSGFESFTPNLMEDIPEEYKSITGTVSHKDIVLGGGFEKTIKLADKFSVVRNFGHNDGSHSQAQDQVFSGHYNSNRIVGATTLYPSNGAITASYFGTNNETNGLPTFVALSKSSSDKPVFLGSKFGPFDPSSKDNLIPKSEEIRFNQRMAMITAINKNYNGGQLEEGWDAYRKQAASVIFGSAKDAFDINKIPQDVRERYGKGLGERLALALRLASMGTKWITVQTSNGWDYHTDIKGGMERSVPELDHGISNLIQDIYDLGLNEKIMVVVTTEFSRTKLNQSNPTGRDHWSRVTPLLISGGTYNHGRMIGSTDKYAYDVKDKQNTPLDLQLTLMNHLGIAPDYTITDLSGRPRALHDTEGKTSQNILLT